MIFYCFTNRISKNKKKIKKPDLNSSQRLVNYNVIKNKHTYYGK